MNLLIFNLAVDEKHVTLSFALKWIEDLSKRFSHIDVVTMRVGDYKLPSNVSVWSIGSEKTRNKILLLIKFYLIIFKIFKKRKIDHVFTHMIPIFAILFWPISFIKNLKNIMWYAHGKAGFIVRIAHLLVHKVVTSTPEGFRIKSNKVKIIGQGADDNIFKLKGHRRTNKSKIHIVTVGRISESKKIQLLIDAVFSWQLKKVKDLKLTIIGSYTNEKEKIYESFLKSKYKEHINSGKLIFSGKLNPADIPAYLYSSDLFINLSITGSLDKAIIEAMLAGCPVMSSNDAFKKVSLSHDFSEFYIIPKLKNIHDKLDFFDSLNYGEIVKYKKKQYIYSKEHTIRKLIVKLEYIIKHT